VDLLLDRGELHELLGELVGVERIERVLVLQLRGEKLQERVEVLRDRRLDVRVAGDRGRGLWRGRRRDQRGNVGGHGWLPLDANVDAAAETDQAAVAANGFGRGGLVVGNDETGRGRVVARRLVAKALVAQRVIDAAVGVQ